MTAKGNRVAAPTVIAEPVYVYPRPLLLESAGLGQALSDFPSGGVDVAQAVMGFENEVEQSIGRSCRRLAEPSGHTISPHASSREGHHATAWWSSFFSSGWI
jgi:hypothetical protein